MLTSAERVNSPRLARDSAVSLVVMLVVVLMLYYFMNVYLIDPILRINRNLGDYLTYKVPFEADVSCRDEIGTLRERIITLISKLK